MPRLPSLPGIGMIAGMGCSLYASMISGHLRVGLLGDEDDAIITPAQLLHGVAGLLLGGGHKDLEADRLKAEDAAFVADNCNLFTHMFPSAFL